MKIAYRLSIAILAAGLCLVSSAANAYTSSLSFVQSTTTPYIWSATFSDPSVSGSFADAFTFTNPLNPISPAGGSANGISLGIFGTNVIFDLFQLVDTTTSTVLASGPTGGTTTAMSFMLSGANDNYALQINGHTDPLSSTGLYAGNIAVSAVPEPRGYAMLLAGLGLIGVTTSRKKKSVTAFS